MNPMFWSLRFPSTVGVYPSLDGIVLFFFPLTEERSGLSGPVKICSPKWQCNNRLV